MGSLLGERYIRTFEIYKPLDIWRLWNRPEAMARKLANNSRGTALMLEMWWRRVGGHRQSGGGLVHSLRLIFIRWVLVFRLVRTNAGRLLCRPGSWWLAEPKATKCYGRLSLSKRVNWVLVLGRKELEGGQNCISVFDQVVQSIGFHWISHSYFKL